MKALLLVNVGTPEASTPEAVGRYLREFLMDKNIITLPRPFRDLLVKGLIVPRRKFTSAEKYRKIWTEKGSPLMVHCQNLKENIQMQVPKDWQVFLAMQVGEPSLKKTLQEIQAKDPDEIRVWPLYPQFADATTGGILEIVSGKKGVKVIPPFYSEPWYIQSLARKIRGHLKAKDHLILSFHGLPISQLRKRNSFCYQSADCCDSNVSCEKLCYRAQCLATARLLQSELSLEEMSVSFQSRLGRAKWIEPSTEKVALELINQGKLSVKVACPGFVADCLETLEEIGVELKGKFLSAGGKQLELIPCLNEDLVTPASFPKPWL